MAISEAAGRLPPLAAGGGTVCLRGLPLEMQRFSAEAKLQVASSLYVVCEQEVRVVFCRTRKHVFLLVQ